MGVVRNSEFGALTYSGATLTGRPGGHMGRPHDLERCLRRTIASIQAMLESVNARNVLLVNAAAAILSGASVCVVAVAAAGLAECT
jgi:hypothetical protein